MKPKLFKAIIFIKAYNSSSYNLPAWVTCQLEDFNGGEITSWLRKSVILIGNSSTDTTLSRYESSTHPGKWFLMQHEWKFWNM